MAKASTNRKEREERRKRKTAEAVRMLEEGVKSAFEGENFKLFLETMGKFRKYSLKNSILIWQQNPEATCVAGYRAWETKFNRHVKKGEKGMEIFVPCTGRIKVVNQNGEEEEKKFTYYRTTTVFDVSQTEGEALPSICNELLGDVEGYSKLMERLIDISPVRVEFGEVGCGAMGKYVQNEKRIVIRPGLSEVQTVKTLVHEIAHAMLHGDKKCKKTRGQREVEAEGTAYVVSRGIGIDTSAYSFDYVASWSSGKEAKERTAALETIKETAEKILAGIGKWSESNEAGAVEETA